jgi:hypothetical protein
MGEFMIDKAAKAVASQPIQFAIALGIVAGVVYFLGRRVVGDAAAAAGGIVTGHNALTRGTSYEGKGVVGTLAGAANSASGGALESIGSAIGGWVFDLTHREYDPSTGLATAGRTLADGARETDSLWGKIGSVILKQ